MLAPWVATVLEGAEELFPEASTTAGMDSTLEGVASDAILVVVVAVGVRFDTEDCLRFSMRLADRAAQRFPFRAALAAIIEGGGPASGARSCRGSVFGATSISISSSIGSASLSFSSSPPSSPLLDSLPRLACVLGREVNPNPNPDPDPNPRLDSLLDGSMSARATDLAAHPFTVDP
jgi:hypothetical protein